MCAAAALLTLAYLAAHLSGAAVAALLGFVALLRSRLPEGLSAGPLFLGLSLLEPALTLSLMAGTEAYLRLTRGRAGAPFAPPFELSLMLTAPMLLLLAPVAGLWPVRASSGAILLAFGLVRATLVFGSLYYGQQPGVGENPVWWLIPAEAAALWGWVLWAWFDLRRLSAGSPAQPAGRPWRRALAAAAAAAAAWLVILPKVPPRLEAELALERSLAVQRNTLQGAAWSPDGRLVAALAKDAPVGVRVWRAQDGAPVRSLALGSSQQPSALAWSPDGQLIAAGDRAGELELWRASDGVSVGGARLRTAAPQALSMAPLVGSLAFSPDGRLLAAGMADGTVRLWAVGQAKELSALPHGPEVVVSVAFSPTQSALASAGTDGTIALWSLPEGRLVRRIAAGHAIARVAFSPDGTLLAAGGRGREGWLPAREGIGLVSLWRAQDGSRLRRLKADDVAVCDLAFRRDGTVLAVKGYGFLKLLRLSDGAWRQEPAFIFEPGLAFSPDGGVLAAAQGNRLALWRVKP
jgi:hypothetical protein